MGSVFGSLPHLKFSGEFGKDEHANTVATYGGDDVVRSSFLTNVFNGNYLGLFLDKIKVFYPKPPTPSPDFLRELDMVVTGMKGSMDSNRHGLLVIVVLLLAVALFVGGCLLASVGWLASQRMPPGQPCPGRRLSSPS